MQEVYTKENFSIKLDTTTTDKPWMVVDNSTGEVVMRSFIYVSCLDYITSGF